MTSAALRGDLLLGTGPIRPLPPVRGPWAQARSAGGPGSATWTGWRSTPGPGWSGYPLAPVAAAGWEAWFVGEATGTDGAVAAAAVLEATSEGRTERADALAAALPGSWLLVGCRGAEVHVWTDRFATVHAFVAADAGRVAVGTSQDACAAAVGPGPLDWTALAAWCAMGFFPGDRTADEHVRVVRPATHLVVGPDGSATTHRTWWWAAEPDEARSRAATVTALDDVLAEVLGQQAAGRRLALPISGGLDSRSTVAVLTAHEGRRQGGELWGYSYGYEDRSVETRIGRRIAAARDLPFEAWTIPPYLLDHLDRAARAIEGAQDLTQTRQLGVVDRVAARADHVMAAHWGDVWLDDMGVPADGSPDVVLDKVRAKFTKPGGQWLLDHVVAPQRPEATTAVADLLHEEFRPYREIGPPDAQARAFKTDQWSFRWTVPSLRAYRAGLTPVLPFYDARVADLLLTVPAPMLAGRGLQLEHLRRTAPDLARIEWQQTGRPVEGGPWDRVTATPTRYARGALRRARAQRSGHPELSRNWEVQFGGATGHAALGRQLLAPGGPLVELLGPAPIQQLLGSLAASPHDAGLGYAASMLLTLSAWLERR